MEKNESTKYRINNVSIMKLAFQIWNKNYHWLYKEKRYLPGSISEMKYFREFFNDFFEYYTLKGRKYYLTKCGVLSYCLFNNDIYLCLSNSIKIFKRFLMLGKSFAIIVFVQP